LRDLGISETRLQNGLVEVWNKIDLLPSAPPADPNAQLPPISEASDEPASTGAKQDYEMCKQAPAQGNVLQDGHVHAQCYTCTPLQLHLCLLLQRIKGSV